jgi:plastocyanin
MKETRLLVLAVLAVAALAALFTRSNALMDRSAAVTAEPLETQVVRASIRDGAFVPAVIRVRAGTTVSWRNEVDIPHTVTGSGGSWDSGVIQPGGSYSRKFDATGTFGFYCVPHPEMTGSVVVGGGR